MNKAVKGPSAEGAAKIMRELFDRAFFWRVSLALMAVLLCLQFDWHLLRFLTSEAALRITAAVGLPIQRVAFDELEFSDTVIQFTVNCTWIVGLFGIVPLLRMRGTWWLNLRRMSLFISGFFLLNLLRIEIIILCYKPGISWNREHGWITGVSEFLVYLWVLNLIDHPLAQLLLSGRLAYRIPRFPISASST
jgi:hypothetical protein